MVPVASQNSTLYVADVRKAFGRRQVLDRVDFTLERGELAGIVGENGAGKTTLLRILAGELKPDHGWVIPRGRLGYCPQRTVLNDSLTSPSTCATSSGPTSWRTCTARTSWWSG